MKGCRDCCTGNKFESRAACNSAIQSGPVQNIRSPAQIKDHTNIWRCGRASEIFSHIHGADTRLKLNGIKSPCLGQSRYLKGSYSDVSTKTQEAGPREIGFTEKRICAVQLHVRYMHSSTNGSIVEGEKQHKIMSNCAQADRFAMCSTVRFCDHEVGQ